MKHRLNRSVRKTVVFCLLLAFVCAALSSCSFSFSLEDALTELKAYINGTEVSQPPAGFVESRENKHYAYDVYTDHVVITAYLGTNTYVEVPGLIDDLPVKKIGGLTFYEGTAVQTVVLPEGITELEENAFYYCTKLKTVVLPETLTALGDKTFSWCSSLEEVTIPEQITAIPAFCFNECTALRAVYLPEGITAVGARAFSGCAALETLHFGDAVESIGDFAFRACPLLKTVRLPGICVPSEQTFADCTENFAVMTEIDSVCWETCTSLGVILREDDGSTAVSPEDTSADESGETSEELTVVG